MSGSDTRANLHERFSPELAEAIWVNGPIATYMELGAALGHEARNITNYIAIQKMNADWQALYDHISCIQMLGGSAAEFSRGIFHTAASVLGKMNQLRPQEDK